MTVGVDVPWTKMIGPEVVEFTDNTLGLKQTPEALHLNHNGDMNAGVICTMVEMAGMGIVVMLLGDLAKQSLIVVKNMNIDFIARAQGVIVFTATMDDEQKNRAINNAKSANKVEEAILVEAKDGDGKLVAKAEVLTYIGPKK